jgi:hypothetical protein
LTALEARLLEAATVKARVKAKVAA